MNLVHFAGIAAGAWLMNRRNTGAIGAIVPDKCVGVTQCADGTWSTLPADRRGVCTHHGGIAEGYRRRVVKEETGEVVDVIEVVDDAGQTADVVEVPVTGYYKFTTYTTQKGKTAPAIAIRFNRKPQPETLEILRNSKFWWNRKEGLWYGWETPKNVEVVESLPVALEGERAPVVKAEEVDEAKEGWPKVGKDEDFTDGTGQLVWVSMLEPVQKTHNGSYPITVWKNKRNGKYYVSSGHATVSRKVVQKYARDGEPDNLVSFGLNEWKGEMPDDAKPVSLTDKDGNQKESAQQPKTAFRIDLPARGRLYSNAEYGDLKILLSAQAIQAKRQLSQAFPEIKRLWKEIEAFDEWGLKNFPKWAAIFSDQPGYYGGTGGSYVPDITQRSLSHPAGLLHHHVMIAYDDFRNAYGLSDERFNEYRNRNYAAVQKFFTERLTEASTAVRNKIKLLKDSFWFSPDVDPQEKIDRGTGVLSTDLLGRILEIVHKINPDEHWVRNLEFNGRRFQKYRLLDGTIRLKDYLGAIERRKAESQQRSDENARRLKIDIAALFNFNRMYLEKGYSFHLPTYSRKIREHGLGIISNKMYFSGSRANESYIEINRMHPDGGYRLMLSIVPGYEVEGILISTALLHECFKGRNDERGIIFGCYIGRKVYPDVLKYIQSEEPIHLLYGLEPAISGYCRPLSHYQLDSLFI